MCTNPTFYSYLALDSSSLFSSIWEMWKHITGCIFTSRDVILGVVGELDSCCHFCHTAWTITWLLVSCSLHSPLKKAESKKNVLWMGQGGQGLSCNLWSQQCYQQPHWRKTTTALNSSWEGLGLHCTPLRCAPYLTAKQTSKPWKGSDTPPLIKDSVL